jgi:hypothetical protein
MIDTLSELYGLFISFLAISLAIGCTIVWIMLIINNRQQESFDEKYRRTRKHDGYKSGR